MLKSLLYISTDAMYSPRVFFKVYRNYHWARKIIENMKAENIRDQTIHSEVIKYHNHEKSRAKNLLNSNKNIMWIPEVSDRNPVSRAILLENIIMMTKE